MHVGVLFFGQKRKVMLISGLPIIHLRGSFKGLLLAQLISTQRGP